MPSLQPSFSPLFAHARPVVRPDEVALALGCTRQQVADLEEQGLLQAFGIGDAADRKREHLRITRSSVEGLFAHRLAQRGAPLHFDLSPEAARWCEHLRTNHRDTKNIEKSQNSEPKTQNPKQ